MADLFDMYRCYNSKAISTRRRLINLKKQKEHEQLKGTQYTERQIYVLANNLAKQIFNTFMSRWEYYLSMDDFGTTATKIYVIRDKSSMELFEGRFNLYDENTSDWFTYTDFENAYVQLSKMFAPFELSVESRHEGHNYIDIYLEPASTSHL